MKLYLAAMYQWMDQMKLEREKFRAAGHVIKAKWINGNEEGMSREDGAQMDLDDIASVNAVVSYTLPYGTMFSSGGRHVEFGYAIALKKQLFIIGEQENVFHHLAYVKVFSSTEDLIASLASKKLYDASNYPL